MNKDIIYRQAAIDAVEHITSSMSVCVNTDECYGMKRMQRRAVIELTNLPSAQPEIVRCKDCKYWEGERRGSFYYFEQCSLHERTASSDDFCSWAERREDEP